MSSATEIIQRLKAQAPGKGDLHVISLKNNDFADAVRANIALEKLYPDRLQEIPNLAKAPKDLLMTAAGHTVDGRGGLILRAAYNTIYNADKIKNPPQSWKELYDRRAEFKGRIATVRPDAKSSGGRSFVYAFLNAMGVDFSKPWPQIQASNEWKDALEKLEEFSKYLVKPVAAEPPIMFEQFKREEAWITSYSTGYVLWTRDRGLLPKSLRATSFSEGDPPGTDGYVVVPSAIPDVMKPLAYRLVNFVMSDKVMLKQVTDNWLLPGTDIWDLVPKEVWTHIPHPSKSRALSIQSKEALDYLRKRGMEHFR